jgi:DNA-binding transcriptional LysR family regulator
MEDLAAMAVFAKVVESKGFSAAARQLGLTKSAVSKQVSRLESSLGARLLNRTTRALSLTEVGGAVYEHCARMVGAAEEAELAVHRLAAAPRGLLRVTASIAFGRQHVAPAIQAFLAAYPEVQVQLMLTDRMVDLADEGFDLAIRIAAQLGDNLVARRLAPVRFVVCAAPEYLARCGAPKKPADLAGHNCLVFSQEGLGDVWRFQSRTGSERIRVSGNYQVNSSEATRDALLAGMGIGLAPTFTVGPDIRAGRLKPVLPRHRIVAPYEAVHAVYLPNRHLLPRMRAFIDCLVERFGPKPYWEP